MDMEDGGGGGEAGVDGLEVYRDSPCLVPDRRIAFEGGMGGMGGEWVGMGRKGSEWVPTSKSTHSRPFP
jgi:hypothetical protein